MSRTPDELRESWKAVIRRYSSKGFEISIRSVLAPLQLEGRLPDGRRFYFRERGGTSKLAVGGDPLNHPDKVVTLELEEGGLLPEEGERVLDQLFSQVLT
jgi:hypothetical protein